LTADGFNKALDEDLGLKATWASKIYNEGLERKTGLEWMNEMDK
jgi:hypothetical protein